MTSFAKDIDHFLKQYLNRRAVEIQSYSPALVQSMEYSLSNGGKRFRPSLCLCAAEALDVPIEQALPFAAALEMVHTYSLIHDDLPCMDNDDERRGQPTNHIVYGEPLALLAGDALLTEAFLLISEVKLQKASSVASLVRILSRAAGASGMVGGQAMDMGIGVPMTSDEALLLCHRGKTAALIAAALEGAGVLAELEADQAEALRQFGELLGLAFQIKDDLLDAEKTAKSVLFYWDESRTDQFLKELESRARSLLQGISLASQDLLDYFRYNYERTQ